MIYLFLLLMVLDVGWAQENGSVLRQPGLMCRGRKAIAASPPRLTDPWLELQDHSQQDVSHVMKGICSIPVALCSPDRWDFLYQVMQKGMAASHERVQFLEESQVRYNDLIGLLEYIRAIPWLNSEQHCMLGKFTVQSKFGLSNIVGMQAAACAQYRSLLRRQQAAQSLVDDVNRQIDELNSYAFALREEVFQEAYKWSLFEMMGTCFLSMCQSRSLEKRHILKERIDATLDACVPCLRQECFPRSIGRFESYIRCQDRHLIHGFQIRYGK